MLGLFFEDSSDSVFIIIAVNKPYSMLKATAPIIILSTNIATLSVVNITSACAGTSCIKVLCWLASSIGRIIQSVTGMKRNDHSAKPNPNPYGTAYLCIDLKDLSLNTVKGMHIMNPMMLPAVICSITPKRILFKE